MIHESAQSGKSGTGFTNRYFLLKAMDVKASDELVACDILSAHGKSFLNDPRSSIRMKAKHWHIEGTCPMGVMSQHSVVGCQSALTLAIQLVPS